MAVFLELFMKHRILDTTTRKMASFILIVIRNFV